ncbi:NAD(P)-dependent glycerol-1-phosphate dehydrogenase [archaeon 13_1_20CM_2_54_9]|nr:MAG: NAD(P)-dependent glycerol-1-phosphate dehydrogenase [Crenarchaeota archaeon 13_1_40CM_3_53_5]OLE75575.1 MAG: NAD(P)-dependent glycerol-1-phosphate dehydrogenase [archaeon 13_1_20CM_2_54_9]
MDSDESQHYTQLPREVIVGKDVISHVGDVCHRLGFRGNALVVSGPITYPLAGERVAKSIAKAGLRVDHVIVKEASESILEEVITKVRQSEANLVLGVGGGKDIDLAKLSSARAAVQFMSIPTAASHDGIASPYASIKGSSKPYSIRGQAPIAILADIGILAQSPYQLLAAGCGDIVAKYTAVKDWQLAHKLKNEYYGDYAAELALMSAELVSKNSRDITQRKLEGVRTVVEALISCGVAMSIAGSSRPCSGAEHLFSHALDIVAGETSLHGERTGVGAILCAYLQGSNWESIRDFLREIGAPSSAKELKVSPSQIVKALTMAHSLRPERYTILGETGVAGPAAERVAKATGVIE